MLNKVALANSLAVVTAVLYVLFALLAMIAPRAFQLLFDAQFFDANVASLFPKVQPSAASLVTLVLMVYACSLCGQIRQCSAGSATRWPDRQPKAGSSDSAGLSRGPLAAQLLGPGSARRNARPQGPHPVPEESER
jgi:hypothetical protein